MAESKSTKPARFGSLLDRWKQADDGSSPFVVAGRKKPITNIVKTNETSIKEYKKTFKTKNFKAKSPTRGMSVYNKPAQLQNVFGAKVQPELKDFEPPVFEKSESEVEFIAGALKKTFLFDDMSKKELKVFTDAFEPTEVKKGDAIIEQGATADFFYLIVEGEVSFHINEADVGNASKGASFGELALLYACPRAATVISESDQTKLYRVDQKTFRSLLQKQTKIMEAQKLTLLGSVNFLKDINEFDMKRLGRAMAPNVFEKGDCLVKKGDEGDAFYIIQEGEMEVTDISVGSTKFEDITLKAGDYFGERALATNEPRAANVTALTKGTAFSIDRSTFERVLGKFSRLIMKAQDRRILEGIDLLAGAELTPKEFDELSHAVVDKTFKAGETIFESMKPHEATLYIVREGTIELSGKRNEEIKPGAYFGEDGLLLDMKQAQVPDKRASTRVIPPYSAKAVDSCLCGILTLSDCRTIFDTTMLVDIGGISGIVVEETLGDESDDDLVACAMAPTSSLNRETTRQWLAKSSKEVLRTAVKENVGLDDLERHSVLGEGQFGEVWLVSSDVPGDFERQHFALKIQMIDDPTRGDSTAAIKREIDVLGLMDHPYIVNLVHYYADEDHLYILMGLVHGGELFDVIHTENDDGTWSSGLPESDAKFYAMVVADTLDYIHRKQFVFRDMKPENVLIDKDGYPIICDFGFAKYVTDKTYTLCGTPNYLSPEVVMNRGHNASSDHWALGVLIYEMVAGENPFFYDGMPQMELFETIVREKFYPLPDEVTDECFYVIDGLLEKDPSRRLGSLAGRGKDIMAKEWFDDLNLDELRQKKHPAPFVPRNTELQTLVETSSAQTLPSMTSVAAIPGSRGGSSFNMASLNSALAGGSGLTGSGSSTVGGSVNRSSLLDDSDDEE